MSIIVESFCAMIFDSLGSKTIHVTSRSQPAHIIFKFPENICSQMFENSIRSSYPSKKTSVIFIFGMDSWFQDIIIFQELFIISSILQTFHGLAKKPGNTFRPDI